jgi:hypothetical protein
VALSAESSRGGGAKMPPADPESEADLKQLRRLFESIDSDGSGLLDRAEVQLLAEQLGATLSTAEMDEAMREMDEDGSGEVDFEEFAEWFTAAKQATGGKWVNALNDKLGELFQESAALMSQMHSGNTDGALGNINQLLADLSEENVSMLRNAVNNIFTPIFDSARQPEERRAYAAVSEDQWAALVAQARDLAVSRASSVPTKYVLVHGLPADVKAPRVEGLIKNLKKKPRFYDWVSIAALFSHLRASEREPSGSRALCAHIAADHCAPADRGVTTSTARKKSTSNLNRQTGANNA